MTYLTECNYEPETHPWPPYITNRSRHLLLGTFPTKASLRDFEFFYPSARNKFWKVMSILAKVSLKSYKNEIAVEERKKILDKLNLAVTDIGYKVLRQNNSSLDNNIFPITFNDIFGLIEKYPNIESVIITSRSTGSSVLSWFRAYSVMNRVSIKLPSRISLPFATPIKLKHQTVKLIIAPSTSSRARHSMEDLIEHYEKILLQ